MKMLLISGGRVDDDYLRDWLKTASYDQVIAADSGLDHCRRLGIRPTEIVGDFDSLSDPALVEEYREKGIPVSRYPARKDLTDTHIAFLKAIEKKPEEVTVLGATGTRLDHTMASIGLLTLMADAGIPCRILDAHNCIEMLSGPETRSYRQTADKSYLSVLACSKEVTGICMEGFEYPLDHAVMHAFDSLGISNEIVAETGTVSVESGYLLVVRSTDQGWRIS